MNEQKENLTIESLMLDFNIDERDFDFALIEDSEITSEEKSGILAAVLNKAGLSKSEKNAFGVTKRRISFRKLLAFVLAAVFILALGSMAVANIVMDGNFADFLKPSSDEQAAVLNAGGAAMEREVKDNGTTVRTRQVVGDSHNLYLLFEVIAPEGMVLDKKQYFFANTLVSVEGVHGMGYYFENLPDDNDSDNKISMVLCLDSSKGVMDKTLCLDLSDLIYYTSEKDDCSVAVEGSWQLDIPLDYTDMSETYKINRVLQYKGQDLKILDMELSPLAVNLKVKGSLLAAAANYLSANSVDSAGLTGIDALENLQLKLKDGSQVEMRSGGSSSNGIKMVLNYQFDRMIDINDIESISFCGQEIYRSE
jgi:hypothetical protein